MWKSLLNLKRTGIFVLFLTVVLGVTAVAQAAIITPTDFVPGDTAIGLAEGDQISPAISHGNGVTLAVWADERSHAGGALFDEHETASDIYGMLLDADGNPLSAMPFPIAQGKASQSSPRIAWNGTNWLVVFTTNTLSGTGFYYETMLAAVRVSPTGQVLDSEPIPLYNTPVYNSWTIASDGTDWIIAYEDNDIFAVKITADGQYQQPATLIVPQTYYLRFNLKLACSSGVCLLTFNEQTTTGAVRFDSNFNILGGGPFMLLDEAFIGDLAANDTGFYAAWPQQLPNFQSAIYGSRIDLNGILLDGAGVNISSGTNQGVSQPVLGWDGVNWRVAWSISFDVFVARVNNAGQVLDPGGVFVPGVTLGEIAVTNNGGLQMIRSEFENNEYDVFTTHISDTYVAGPDIPLSLGMPAQTRADTAVGSNGYMIVYHSAFADSLRLMAQPLDASGSPLTAEPILLDTGDWSTGPGTPSVAWNGSNYMVSWGNDGTIYAQRLQQDGSLIDANPIPVIDGFGPTDISAIGDTYLVAGRQFGTTTQIINAFAARVDGATGTVLDATPLVVGFNHVRSISLTTMGNRWFFAYQRNVTHDDPLAETRGEFINADGSVDPDFLIYGFYSSTGGNSIFRVAAAASDTTALVVQSNEVTSGVETDLIGVLVNSDGTVQPSQNLTPWSGNQYRPHLTWDGSQFIMAYNEQRNRFAPLTLDQLDARSDLYGMRISETGTVIDPQGFIFSNSPLSEAYPSVVGANGVALFTGAIFQNSAAAYRIGYQQFGVGGNQWPVAVAGADATMGDVPFTVNFDSTGSADPDGSISSYLWDFGDGSTSTAANPSHAYTTPGDYVATLTVTDNQGATTSNAVAIAAQAPNINPIAVISADVASGPAPLSVVFSASGSYDPDGSIGNIEFDFGDGSFPYWGSPAYHTFTTEGTYTVTVTVYDGRGGTGTASMIVNVGPEPPNQPPTAVAEVTVDTGPAPFNPAFSSANSSDPDGFITGWLWDFGDGTTSTLPNPAIKVYETPGVYTVTLTVTDDDGATGSDSLVITVTDGGCTTNCLRSTNILFRVRPRGGSNYVVIGGVFVNDENGARMANAAVSATWTLPDGSTRDQTVTTNSRGTAVFRVRNVSGTYTLTINDITLTNYTFDPDNSVLNGSVLASGIRLGPPLFMAP